MAFWEVHVQFVYGTSMMFGIGQKCSKLVSPVIFENLTGNDSYSYGLSHKGVIYHNRDESSYCEPFKEREEVTVGVLFDGPNRQLSYFVNGVFMGVAFHDIDLNENVYYPMISRYTNL
jgi:SPRY domain-containing SOCS box protein 3